MAELWRAKPASSPKDTSFHQSQIMYIQSEALHSFYIFIFGFHYANQADLKLAIPLPLPLHQVLEYRHGL